MAIPMQPNSKYTACLRVLAEGPATTGEIVAETGLTPKHVNARLTEMMARGKVSRSPVSMGHSKWMWSLNEGVEVPHAP